MAVVYLSLTNGFSITGIPGSGGQSGYSVSNARHAKGDWIADIIIGAPYRLYLAS